MDAAGLPEDPVDGASARFRDEAGSSREHAPGASPQAGQRRDGVGDALGVEIQRWLSQADGRLELLDARAAELPRADDFGHVTAPRPPSASRPTPARREVLVAVASSIPSERHGIFVASGWGARERTA